MRGGTPHTLQTSNNECKQTATKICHRPVQRNVLPVRSKNAKFHASLNSSLCRVEVQQFVGIVSCKTRPCSANHFCTKPDVQQQNMPRYPPPCRSISALLQSILGGLSKSKFVNMSCLQCEKVKHIHGHVFQTPRFLAVRRL